MRVRAIQLLITIILGGFIGLSLRESLFSKDNELSPEEIVAANLKSIGDPGLLKSVKNRGMSGTTSVEFIQGGVGTLAASA